MEPTPQQIKEDVLVGPLKPPPSNLEVTSHRNGLLEDLVVLGNLPIMEVVIWTWVLFINTDDTNYQKG